MQALARPSLTRPLQAGRRANARAARSSVKTQAAERPVWLPGSPPAPWLPESLPGNYGFDPLGLGANPDSLKWFAEAERIHARWAMLGVAGILVQEIIRPDIFWYTAPQQLELPQNLGGLIAFQIFVMHWTELRRGADVLKPGSVDQDPIFPNNKLPPHEPGYPGGIFAPFIPGDLEELKVKEIKNGRLAMLAFIGFSQAAQVSGLNPLAALGAHIADPLNTSIFGKAIVVPGTAISPPCAIEPTFQFFNYTLPSPCLWWP